MRGKNTETRTYSATLFLLTLFFLAMQSVAHAQVAASIEAADGRNAFYPNEVREFRIIALNTGTQRLLSEKVRIETGPELQLLDDYRETTRIELTIPDMPPGAAVTLPFSAKAGAATAAKTVLSASFGQTTFDQLAALSQSVVKGPLRITQSIKTTNMTSDETNRLEIRLRNDSNRSVSQLRIQTALEEPFLELSPRVYTRETLDANGSVDTVAFEFIDKGNRTGRYNAGLVVEYADANGFHRQDFRYPVTVNDRSASIGIALVLVLILAYWMYTHRAPAPKSAPKSAEKKK